jgi:G3E family GTPase
MVDAPPGYPDFTPVHLITGFLGSGKTTLLKRMLQSPALADTAVLINEFGEIGLDHELLERIDENMVLLRAGCLCCTIRAELAEAIRDLHERRAKGDIPAFRRLVIESTGLADPLPILTTITADPVLRHHYRLGLVIATVDAINGSWQLSHQPESMKQAAVADRLAITKTDIAGQDQVDALTRRLRRINPAAPIFRPAAGEFDPEDILGHDLFDLESKSHEVQRWFHVEAEALVGTDHGAPASPHPHRDLADHNHDANRHGDDIESFHLVFDQPINWTAFGLWLSMLLHRHGEAILRVKGLLSIEGESAPVAIHGVQQLEHSPTHLNRWPSDDRRTRIVFICRGLDPDLVRRSFAAFVLKRGSGRGPTPVPSHRRSL